MLMSRHAVAIACLSWLNTGCVEPFAGAHIQFELQPSVQPPARAAGPTASLAQPPANTFYTFYAIRHVYETDADGDLVVSQAFASHVKDFEVNRLIELDSPCFIELEEDVFPGLHSTQEVRKLKAVHGISDAIAETDRPLAHRVEILTAQRRHDVQIPLQNTVKVVTGLVEVLPPGVHQDFPVGTSCVSDGGDKTSIPPIDCIDEASNRVRLSLCRAFWDAHPSFYQGNDRTFSLPRNGEWFGVVNGSNPVNASPYLAGAGFFVDPALRATEVDAFLMNWQYKDLDGDGAPDYPAGLPDEEKPRLGYHYMAGEATTWVRGVINIAMANRTIPTLSADITIYPSIADDHVQF